MDICRRVESTRLPSDHDLTVVVPAFNEAQRLPSTLLELARFLDEWGIDYRVVVVDDGSRDATARVTDEFGPRFSTVSLPENRGKGAAVRTGMLQASGRIVSFLDADLPFALDCLRQGYLSLVSGGADVVFGARDVEGAAVQVRRRPIRTLASAVFRGIVRTLISRQVTDTQAGFKMFHSSAANRLFALATLDGFAFDAEIVFLTHQLRLRYRRQPVVLINDYQSSLSLMRHTLPMFLDLFRIRWQSFRGAYAEPTVLPLPRANGVFTDRVAA